MAVFTVWRKLWSICYTAKHLTDAVEFRIGRHQVLRGFIATQASAEIDAQKTLGQAAKSISPKVERVAVDADAVVVLGKERLK